MLQESEETETETIPGTETLAKLSLFFFPGGNCLSQQKNMVKIKEDNKTIPGALKCSVGLKLLARFTNLFWKAGQWTLALAILDALLHFPPRSGRGPSHPNVTWQT